MPPELRAGVGRPGADRRPRAVAPGMLLPTDRRWAPGGWRAPRSAGWRSSPAPCSRSPSPTGTTVPPADAPQVLVIHALTGSADAAGDWWAPAHRPGPGPRHGPRRRAVRQPPRRALWHDRADLEDPATGVPYGAAFPQPTARDQAAAPLVARRPRWASSASRSSREGRWAAWSPWRLRCDTARGRAAPVPSLGARGHGRDGHRLEPHPARAHRRARRRGPRRSPASWR